MGPRDHCLRPEGPIRVTFEGDTQRRQDPHLHPEKLRQLFPRGCPCRWAEHKLHRGPEGKQLHSIDAHDAFNAVTIVSALNAVDPVGVTAISANYVIAFKGYDVSARSGG